MAAVFTLLHNPSALELEVTNWWLNFLLQDFLIECRIHDSINYGKSSRSWSCKAAPDHHTATTIFDCWYDVLFMKCCDGFMPDVTGHTHLPKSSTFVVSVQNICPQVLGIIKIVLANVRLAFVFFFGQHGFCFGTLPWMLFMASFFLIVESWTLT